ncbi:MAG TPA: AAA family ATPase [Spirochaetota bacterium]|nr:AAA family ATPase [Spirochaetota bacterium]
MTNLFIAATSQNAGKTTASLGLLNHFNSKGIKTGFIKPVGQRYLEINNNKVDEDSVFIKKVFNTPDSLSDMNPVAIPRGFTTHFINHRKKYHHLQKKITTAYKNVSKKNDIVIVEGTGHSGVGAIFELHNAKVAKMLDTKAIIVTEGGIGRAIDEIILNSALLEKQGVEVIGVIINKVLEEKYKKIKKILTKALNYENIPALGFLPHQQLLTLPHIYQVKKKLKAEIICGANFMDKYVNNIVIGAMEAQNTIKHLSQNSVLITPGDRVDNILVSISAHLTDDAEATRISGLILTCGIKPHKRILGLLKKSSIPVLYTKEDTYGVASKVYSMTIKTQSKDTSKISMIKEMFDKYIDCRKILKSIRPQKVRTRKKNKS